MNSMEKNTNYKIRLNNINTFIFDFDGVLSDGTVILESSGEMVRSMTTRDGFAIQYAAKNGYNVCIISGGNSTLVEKRMNYLGVKDVFLSAGNKIDIFKNYCKEKNIKAENVLYMGDDIPDYECMKEAGIGSCPKDAVTEVRNVADYISHFNVGKGCVRDVIEQTLKVQDNWVKLA